MALWPQKYIYIVNVIRYSEPEQIYVRLHVLSFILTFALLISQPVFMTLLKR